MVRNYLLKESPQEERLSTTQALQLTRESFFRRVKEQPVLDYVDTINTNPEKTCSLCATFYSMFKRRHHCRICGKSVCGSCAKTRACLCSTFFPKRCCDQCSRMLMMMSQQNDPRVRFLLYAVNIPIPKISRIQRRTELESVLEISSVKAVQTDRSFIINAPWIFQWFRYVQLEEYIKEEELTLCLQEKSVEEIGRGRGRREEQEQELDKLRPGPISNFQLIDINGGELRPFDGLCKWDGRSGDFLIISEAEWMLHWNRYGGGPAIWFDHEDSMGERMENTLFWHIHLQIQIPRLNVSHIKATRKNSKKRMKEIALHLLEGYGVKRWSIESDFTAIDINIQNNIKTKKNKNKNKKNKNKNKNSNKENNNKESKNNIKDIGGTKIQVFPSSLTNSLTNSLPTSLTNIETTTGISRNDLIDNNNNRIIENTETKAIQEDKNNSFLSKELMIGMAALTSNIRAKRERISSVIDQIAAQSVKVTEKALERSMRLHHLKANYSRKEDTKNIEKKENKKRN